MQKIKAYTQQIEQALANYSFGNKPMELYEPIRYILDIGGKRLRPALTLAVAEMYGTKPSQALNQALSIEVFHNFSLLHDDIMDKAPLRRGQATVHEKWNNDIAILSGDAMLVKAYQLLAMADAQVLPQLLEVFSKTALQVCEGQQYDLNFESLTDVSLEDYLHMIKLKTSVLLGAAAQMGAIVAGANSHESEKVYQFAVNIGIAFQIQDDILDAFGDVAKFGKTSGGDILNDKKTILMIDALSKADETQQAILRKTFETDQEKVTAVKTLFKELGSLDFAQQKMEEYYQMALTNLQATQGDEELKEELKGFAQWLIQRED